MSGFYRDGQWVDTSETPWGESMTPNVNPKDAQIESLNRLLAEKDKEIERLKEDNADFYARIAELEAENTKLKCLLNTAV